MDCRKVGNLIRHLRKEQNLTQRQLAEQIHVSSKAVSKWECGNGVPDASFWEPLSAILGADVLKLLQGELEANRRDVGKMDKTRFYVCPVCGNILTSTGKGSVSCCGRRLAPLEAAVDLPWHEISVQDMDLDYYITLNHEMTKEHFILFAAYVLDDSVFLKRLYPEQAAAFRLPVLRSGGTLYIYCTQHGLVRYTDPMQMA